MKIRNLRNSKYMIAAFIGLVSGVCLSGSPKLTLFINAQEAAVVDAVTEDTITESAITEKIAVEDEIAENVYTEDAVNLDEYAFSEEDLTRSKVPIVEIDGVIYAYGQMKVTGYVDGLQGEVVIRSSVTVDGKTYSVIKIDDNAFKDCTGITKVTISEYDNLDEDRNYDHFSIGNSAFEGCTSLKEVVLSKDVYKLDKKAFAGCISLEKINLNDLMADAIGDYAFNGCKNLISIDLPLSINNLGNGAFMNTGLTELVIPDRKDNVVLLTIGESAFCGCEGIKKLTINDTRVMLDSKSFINCKALEEITMPITTYYGQAVFEGCENVKKLIFTNTPPRDENSAYNTLWGGYSDCTLVYSERDYHHMAGMFDGAEDIEVVLTDNVKNIGYQALEGFSQMTKLTLSDKNYSTPLNDTTSGSFELSPFALKDCTGLTRIDFPESKYKSVGISIGGGAFWGCTSLSTVTFPSNTNWVYMFGLAFRDCTSLTTISFPEKVYSTKFEQYYDENSVAYYDYFEGSGLKSVYYHNKDSFIDSYGPEEIDFRKYGNIFCNAYSQIFPKDVVIYGKKDSSAQAYAKYYGNEFKLIGKSDDTPAPAVFVPVEGGGGAIDTQPAIQADTTKLTLIKGQKFVLGNTDWKSSAPGIVSVSKGAVTAKKAGEALLTRSGSEIAVTVIAPVIPKTAKTIKMTAGDTYKLTPPEVGGLEIIYDSLSPDVATVDEEGNVTALSKGSAAINAYVNGVAFKYTVKVSDTFTGKYDFSKEVLLVPIQTLQIKIAGFKPAKATWSSDKPAIEAPKGYVFANDVVMINKSGKMTAIGVGTTDLTATGGSAEPVTITVTVSEPVTKTLHINKGTSKTVKLFGVKGTPDWKTEDTGVTIKSGKITGDTPGEKLLTATSGNFTYKLMVYVEDPSISDSSFSGKNYKYSINMSAGEAKEIKFENINRNVIFTGNRNDVAFADRDLVIHARSKGTAVLNATVNGKKITINVNVK